MLWNLEPMQAECQLPTARREMRDMLPNQPSAFSLLVFRTLPSEVLLSTASRGLASSALLSYRVQSLVPTSRLRYTGKQSRSSTNLLASSSSGP